MGEVDRRGFLRLRRKEADEAQAEPAEPAEPTEKERQIAELADFTSRLLADVEAQDDETVGEGPALTKAFDLSYIRITPNYIVYSVVTGFSAIVKTSDVTALEVDKPVESKGHGNLSIGVLRFHHPAEMAGVTRSFAWRFPEEDPLVTAIRTACNLPEPEPEPEEETVERSEFYDPEEEGIQWK
jgi:hypothetical protein